MDASIRHTIFSEDVYEKIKKPFIYYRDRFNKRFENSYTKRWMNEVVVPKATATLDKIRSDKLMNLAKTKIGKGGIVAAAGIVAYNLIMGGVRRLNSNTPAIPHKYDRGYDTINENLTDFNSPVSLAKAVSKTITPYKSTIRKSFNTSCAATIMKNQALSAHRSAIGHTKF